MQSLLLNGNKVKTPQRLSTLGCIHMPLAIGIRHSSSKSEWFKRRHFGFKLP